MVSTRRQDRDRDPFAEAARELEGPAEIAPPDLQPLPGGVGYVAAFADARARLTIDQIRQSRDGLRGEVLVEVGPFRDGAWRPLTAGRLELSSLSQRETWERRLRKRWVGSDWDAVLDRFSAAILHAERRLEEPMQWIRDAVPPPADDHLLTPLVLGRLPTLWFGDGGTLKSFVALAAGVSVECGDGVIGGLQPGRRARALYADFELSVWDHRERMRRLLGFNPLEPTDGYPELAYLGCKGSSLAAQVERVQHAVRDARADWLIVDSVSEAAEGPLNDDETARLYYRSLGQIGLPSLSIAHVSKNGDPKRPFGSAHWYNLTRLAWRFDLVGEPGPETAVKLTCVKSSTEQLPAPVGLIVRFDGRDGPVRINRTDPGSMVGRTEELWRQVKALLARENRAMTYAEIGLALGAEADAVRKRVAEHRDVFVTIPEQDGRKVRVALLTRRRDG